MQGLTIPSPNDSARSPPRSQDLRRPVVSFRACFPCTATKASAPPPFPLAGSSWVTTGCCGGAVGRSTRFPQPRAVGCVCNSMPGRCGRPRTNGRPVSPRASAMPSAGVRSGSTQSCAFAPPWPGCWPPSRPNRSNQASTFLLYVGTQGRVASHSRAIASKPEAASTTAAVAAAFFCSLGSTPPRSRRLASSRASLALARLTSGYRPSASTFSLPPKRYFHHQLLAPATVM